MRRRTPRKLASAARLTSTGTPACRAATIYIDEAGGVQYQVIFHDHVLQVPEHLAHPPGDMRGADGRQKIGRFTIRPGHNANAPIPQAPEKMVVVVPDKKIGEGVFGYLRRGLCERILKDRLILDGNIPELGVMGNSDHRSRMIVTVRQPVEQACNMAGRGIADRTPLPVFETLNNFRESHCEPLINFLEIGFACAAYRALVRRMFLGCVAAALAHIVGGVF